MRRITACAAALLCCAIACSKQEASPTQSEDSRPLLGSFRSPVDLPLPPFEFTDQDGRTVTRETLSGKVWIANFIFIHCAGPCPDMSAAMSKIQAESSGWKDFALLTFSVDPVRDTLPDLKAYGERYGADHKRWWFLRSTSEAVGALQAEGFKIGDPTEPANHSERFCLVDQRGHVRGYYNAREATERAALLADADKLLRGEPPQRKAGQ